MLTIYGEENFAGLVTYCTINAHDQQYESMILLQKSFVYEGKLKSSAVIIR